MPVARKIFSGEWFIISDLSLALPTGIEPVFQP
jgi:hypothetical protein